MVLVDGGLPEKQFESSETIYDLYCEITQMDRAWIPLLKKINFFVDKNKLVGVYAVVVSDELILSRGNWIPISQIIHGSLCPEDFEIYQVAVNMI